MKIKAITKHRYSLIEDIKYLLKTKFKDNFFTFRKGDIYVELTRNGSLKTSCLYYIKLEYDNLYFQFIDIHEFDLELPDETLQYIKNILTSEKPTL